MSRVQAITSRDNPLLVRLRRLQQDGAAYRKLGQAWIEGEHLCAALRARGGSAAQAVVSEAAWGDAALRELASAAAQVAVLPAALFKTISGLESPAALGFLIELPPPAAIDADAPSVVLDRLQDAGNVGSILRSAAAFGFTQVLAIKGTAALWSPKVLRAGMGAHFGLRLAEGLDEAALDALRVPLVATSSHAGALLPDADLPRPCAWVLGHEGQGVAAALLARCALQVRIPQPGGEESLNVAAAAAVCLYESARRAL
ncbi:MAG: RNA methyltransferase [Burkholderiales bacterium]|nr:RNA methyltransferase [Burkholderiales bacterium]